MFANNIIITSYYFNKPDPQRNKHYKEDFNYMKKFYDSIIKFDLNCIVLNTYCNVFIK